MRPAVLLAASCLASACATRSPPPAEPGPRPAAEACDPRLEAEPAAEPPVLGGIVQPITPEERAATAAFLAGEAEARQWGREGWRRAELARRQCHAERTIGTATPSRR